jgi:hypothetical protein
VAAWRYVFADLLTDTDVAEIEVTGARFDSRIIIPGAFSATIPVPNPAIAAQARTVIPDPFGVPQTICHVMRGGDIWDSYVIWTAEPSLDGKGTLSVSLQGATLESWLDHRLTSDADFVGVDQIDIARTLLANAQVGHPASPWWPISANLGITTAPAGGSGVLRDRSYLITEATMVGQRLQELANCDNGFEYRITVYRDPDTGVRVRQWTWGYPMLGSSDTARTYESPGDILSFKYPVDVTAGGTAFWVRGDSIQDDATADSQPLMAGPVTAEDLFARGWVWLDHVADLSGVSDLTELGGYAQWLANAKSGGVRIAQADIRLTDRPDILTPAQLGNYAQLVVKNDLWPLLQGTWRVVGISVTPQDRSSGQDKATLIFADIG